MRARPRSRGGDARAWHWKCVEEHRFRGRAGCSLGSPEYLESANIGLTNNGTRETLVKRTQPPSRFRDHSVGAANRSKVERCMSPRKSFAIAFALLVASSAHAAILFIEAEVGFAVSPQPDYLSVGDMNMDGLDDVIAISTQSDEVNVLLAAPDQPSGFRSVSVATFGSRLRRGAVADVSRDGKLDLVVPDQRQDGVWVLRGDGQGRLLNPTFVSVGRNPFAVAIADFDGVRGADIAVTDTRLGNVTILLNDGGEPPRFTRGPIFAVGESPESIVVLDVNDDGDLDLVTLNVGGPRVKSISVLLFDQIRAGLPVFRPAENFGVGERPEALNVADLNNDGLADLIMLNRPRIGANSDVNIMLSRGDGVFDGPTEFEVACPFFTGSANCRSRALATGDFDNNGTVDLAVFLTDPRVGGNGSGTDHDALRIYAGRGDGMFAAGAFLRTPKVPRSAISADLNGDGLIDLAVGLQRISNVTAFINASTPGEKGNGEDCVVGGVCLSGICVQGVCCASACNDNESCAIPRREGICQRVAGEPIPCDFDDECIDVPDPGDEGTCRNNFCCEDSCPEGRCDVAGFEGLCIPTLNDGSECFDEFDCNSSFCVDGTCCREACTSGFCGNVNGICEPPIDLGQPCNEDGQCGSNICDVFVGLCCRERCREDQECDADGNCVAPPPPLDGQPGDSCLGNTQCANVQCVNSVCCLDASCPEGEVCLPPNGNCAPEPTPTATPVPKEDGSFCDDPSQCISTFCENFICCSEECVAGEFCSAEDAACREGTPPATPTATPIEVCQGISCSGDEECIENDGRGVCVDVCNGGLCPVGESCVPESDGGEVCVDSCQGVKCSGNSTCVIGNSGKAICANPCGDGFCEPGETCQESEFGQPLCISSTRSGGCAVVAGGSVADLWVLVLLPLALLGLRRLDMLRRVPVGIARK